jgi:predicted nucleic acid-binding Zn ribbon protein
MNETDNSLTPIKDIIANLLGDSNLAFNPDDARIWEVWNDVVGPTIAEIARPSWIKNKRLIVIVRDSVWLQELNFAGESIKEDLNRELQRDAIHKIEFRIGIVR